MRCTPENLMYVLKRNSEAVNHWTNIHQVVRCSREMPNKHAIISFLSHNMFIIIMELLANNEKCFIYFLTDTYIPKYHIHGAAAEHAESGFPFLWCKQLSLSPAFQICTRFTSWSSLTGLSVFFLHFTASAALLRKRIYFISAPCCR